MYQVPLKLQPIKSVCQPVHEQRLVVSAAHDGDGGHAERLPARGTPSIGRKPGEWAEPCHLKTFILLI